MKSDLAPDKIPLSGAVEVLVEEPFGLVGVVPWPAKRKGRRDRQPEIQYLPGVDQVVAGQLDQRPAWPW